MLLGADDGMFCTVPRSMTGLTPFPFLAVAGGAGLLGGVVLGEAFENHEEREREEAYDQGQLSFVVSNFLI
jgi:hypothetical protein